MGVINALTGAVASLDQVTKVIRLTGFVACTPAFREQPQVINAASELMLEVFGPVVGRHARSALGVASLPLGAPVEVEAIFEVEWGKQC
jgi:enamine deaminase RidA (YjgF/YER057c/UK114 family)